jgi:hypothetical protein
MLNKIFKLIKTAVRMRCFAAADDYLSPPATILDAGSGALVRRGKVGSTEFKNLVATLRMGHNDSVSGSTYADIIYTRTSPVDDANYEALPIGSLCLFQTVASTVVTDADYFVLNIHGWSKFMTNLEKNTINCIATTALATSSWHAMNIKSKVPTGVTSAGQQSALYIETEVTGTGICTGSHYGIKVETYIVSTATMSGDHYGIAVFTYSDIAGNQAIDCLRLEHNGASVAQGFLNLQAQAGKMRWLWTSSTTDATWMSVTTTPTCSTAGGWLIVKHGGYTRYLQLYTTVS